MIDPAVSLMLEAPPPEGRWTIVWELTVERFEPPFWPFPLPFCLYLSAMPVARWRRS